MGEVSLRAEQAQPTHGQQSIPSTTMSQATQITVQPPLGVPPGFAGNEAAWDAPVNTSFDNIVYKLHGKAKIRTKAEAKVSEALVSEEVSAARRHQAGGRDGAEDRQCAGHIGPKVSGKVSIETTAPGRSDRRSRGWNDGRLSFKLRRSEPQFGLGLCFRLQPKLVASQSFTREHDLVHPVAGHVKPPFAQDTLLGGWLR